VAVVLDEYHVKVTDAAVASHRVTYHVLNTGHEKHEMALLRTDLDPASLPTDNAGQPWRAALLARRSPRSRPTSSWAGRPPP